MRLTDEDAYHILMNGGILRHPSVDGDTHPNGEWTCVWAIPPCDPISIAVRQIIDEDIEFFGIGPDNIKDRCAPKLTDRNGNPACCLFVWDLFADDWEEWMTDGRGGNRDGDTRIVRDVRGDLEGSEFPWNGRGGNGMTGFDEVIRTLKKDPTRRFARSGWNGKGIWISLQVPDEHSKMTAPYIYMDTTELISNNPDARRERIPWLASQADMLADDWGDIEGILSADVTCGVRDPFIHYDDADGIIDRLNHASPRARWHDRPHSAYVKYPEGTPQRTIWYTYEYLRNMGITEGPITYNPDRDPYTINIGRIPTVEGFIRLRMAQDIRFVADKVPFRIHIDYDEGDG